MEEEMNGLQVTLTFQNEAFAAQSRNDASQAFHKLCAAIADEPERHMIFDRAAHAAFVAGCAG